MEQHSVMGCFIMSTLENLPNPDGTVCEKNNGMDVEGPLETYCISCIQWSAVPHSLSSPHFPPSFERSVV